jgi:hypothetical protein
LPIEHRTIRFEQAEVVQAVREYLRRRGQQLPAGTISAVHVGDAGEELVQYTMIVTGYRMPQIGRAMPRDPDRHEVVLKGASLKAALILYCRDLKIPLPAAASKVLRWVEPYVCLTMELKTSATIDFIKV